VAAAVVLEKAAAVVLEKAAAVKIGSLFRSRILHG
jgi:hypothetical protein